MRIFVAGPWGDYNPNIPSWIVSANIAKADWVGQQLVHLGHDVYIPHTMCATWSGKFSRPKMAHLDDSFLLHWAEAFFMIPGESTGAIKELAVAADAELILFVEKDVLIDEYMAPRQVDCINYKEVWNLLAHLIEMDKYASNRLQG